MVRHAGEAAFALSFGVPGKPIAFLISFLDI